MSQKQQQIKIQNLNNSSDTSQTVEVLYQKIGNRWFAFALDGDDVFVGSLTEEEIHAANGESIEKVLVQQPAEGPHEQFEIA